MSLQSARPVTKIIPENVIEQSKVIVGKKNRRDSPLLFTEIAMNHSNHQWTSRAALLQKSKKSKRSPYRTSPKSRQTETKKRKEVIVIQQFDGTTQVAISFRQRIAYSEPIENVRRLYRTQRKIVRQRNFGKL